MSDILLKDYIKYLEIRKEYFRDQRLLEGNIIAKMHNAKMQNNYKRVKSELASAKRYMDFMGGEV